jgi:hypothetical protein
MRAEVTEEGAGELAPEGQVVLRQQTFPGFEVGGVEQQLVQCADHHHEAERDGGARLGMVEVLRGGEEQVDKALEGAELKARGLAAEFLIDAGAGRTAAWRASVPRWRDS